MISLAELALNALVARAAVWGFKELKAFLISQLGDLAKKKEDELNAELANIKKGDMFFGRLVVEVEPTSVLILFRETGINVLKFKSNNTSDFQADTEPVEGIYIDLARSVIRIDKTVNLTDAGRPPIKVIDVVTYAIQATVNRENYEISIGGGKEVNYWQFELKVRFDSPEFWASGYYARNDESKGFIIDLHSILPWPIPLGNSGLALIGLGLIYGERFAPRLTETGNPLEEMRKAKAENYVSWIRDTPNLEKWASVDADLRVFALDADVGDLATAGRLVRFERSGLAYISFGPIIFVGGRMVLLDRIPVADSFGAIDIRSKTAYLSVRYRLSLAESFTIAGNVECSIDLHDQNRTFISIGGSAMDGAKVVVFDLLELSGGAKLIPLQGFTSRAGARIEGSGELLGFGGGFSLSFDTITRIGWNPAEIGGQVLVDGAIWIRILGKKLTIGVGASLEFQVPEPTKLHLRVVGRIKLSWPFKGFSISVTIFDKDLARIAKAKPSIGIHSAQPLSFFHWSSGTTGVVDDTNSKVLPDVSFDIPFQRIARVGRMVVNAQASDGSYNEGGIEVLHTVSRLALVKIDEATGTAEDVPDLNAAWLTTASSGAPIRTARLAFPSNNPFAWLQSFEYAAPDALLPAEHLVFQTFGEGPAEQFLPVGGMPAMFELETIRITSPTTIDLRSYGWLGSYPRAIAGKQSLEIGVYVGRLALTTPVEVVRFDLRVIGAKSPPSVSIENGMATPVRVRALTEDFVEWSIVVVVTRRDMPIEVNFGDEGTIMLLAVGYVAHSTNLYQGQPQAVLRPGKYRLEIDGETSTLYKGRPGPPTAWPPFRKTLDVIPPENLRPYLRYSTCGDERIFGIAAGGWNPNPAGLGFGHYSQHLGVARARVGYLSKIYSSLRVTIENPADGVAREISCPVIPNSEGTTAGNKLSQDWENEFGGANLQEEEFSFEMPTSEGEYQLHVYREDGGREIDTWSCRVSKFKLPSEHLTLADPTLQAVYGPYGRLPLASTPFKKRFPKLDAIPDAVLATGSTLPEWLQQERTLADPDAALSFLRAFEWVGFFDSDPVPVEHRLFSLPVSAEITIVNDQSDRPVAFLYRTPEPLDWRRVALTVGHGNGSKFERRFRTRLAPSPDGCACLVFLEAENTLVRVPLGIIAMRVEFRYVSLGLPTLIDGVDRSSTRDEVAFAFHQPLGLAWPGTIAFNNGAA
ncbi:hypothetical protein [Sinorhizobium meliloti]|uniref:hypothetical protein n=1 Tax=Rhizobium meliloti TaxID=382 RepID=UPI000EFC13A8|nr:hypothetical protein [Sinorhizobium meliloti]RMC64872.1 hypothetical protein EBB04_22230 [Sinorhizobium meliloti]